MQTVHRISGAEKLIAVFGHWPSFHDAEVIWLKLDRRSNGKEHGPTLEAQIHAWEMTNEVDEHGYYVLRHHVLVSLKFLDVEELRLNDFNHQMSFSAWIFPIHPRTNRRIAFSTYGSTRHLAWGPRSAAGQSK